MDKLLRELYTAFTEAGIPYAYNVFPYDEEHPMLPYVSAVVTGGSAFEADDSMYYVKMNVELKLFTKYKKPALEDTVREIFSKLEIQYTWAEEYITDAKLYVITYRFEMRGV